MTTEERLAAIENELSLRGVTGWHGSRWLIAEVRRLTDQRNEAVAEAPTIIAKACDEAYARGRADERQSILQMIRTNFSCSGYDIKRTIERGVHLKLEAIERGEHVAEVKDGP